MLVVVGHRVEAKLARRAAWSAAALLFGIGLWSTHIEPRWLEVTHHRIESAKIQQPVRLVVVADLQTDRWGQFETNVIDEIVRQEPDIVLMTGDYVQLGGAGRAEVVTAFRRALAQSGLAPPGGIFAVGGDVEPPGWEVDFQGTQVKALVATTGFEAAGLAFTALDARTSRHATEPGAGPIQPSERFHVAFGHAPDFALAMPPADLMLAGHVHGGQVRLPFWGPLLTLTSVPRSWAVGRTDLDGGAIAGGRTLIVSRGIGMERGHAPRLRFLCRPELMVVDLSPRHPDTLMK
jgi:predicted MPP superfamily phosphohydrolase